MRSLFGELRERILGKNIKIVFPEGNDDRVVRAAARLKFEGLVDPIILGDPAEVHKILNDLGFADFNYTIINPETYEGFEEMKEKFVEIRKGKATIEDADKLLRDVNYFGVMLVKLGLADGMVSGAIHSTADTVRPALQVIKTKPGISRTSGVFLMNRENTNQRLVLLTVLLTLIQTLKNWQKLLLILLIQLPFSGLILKWPCLASQQKVLPNHQKWIRLLKQQLLLRRCVLTWLLMVSCSLMQPLFQQQQLLRHQTVT